MTTSLLPYAVRRSSPTEHQLVAGRDLSAGELILCEQAIAHVSMGRYRFETYAWDLVDELLADKGKMLAYTRCRLLTVPLVIDLQDLSVEGILVKKHHKSRAFVRNLYLGVVTNSIGIIDEDRLVRGHGLFPLLSRADHSCVPNSALTPANWRARETSLVAKRNICAGEPLTWSYFRESEFVPADWMARNYNLVNLYRFACRCSRCELERPAEVPSAPAGLVAYFDKLICEEARQMANSTDCLEMARAHSPIPVCWDRLRAKVKR